MPQTYYDFDPWKRAADNIASGMVAVAQARNRKAMFDAEQAAMAPVRAAQIEQAQATTRKVGADAEAAEYELQRRRTVDGKLDGLMSRVEAGTVIGEDGLPQFSPEAHAAFNEFQMYIAKDASDAGSGLKYRVEGMSFGPNERAKRKNQQQMNDADNAAAMKRTEVMAGNKSSKINSIAAQEAKERMAHYSKKIADLGPQPEKNSEDWMDKHEFYQNKYLDAQKDLKRFSAPDENNSLTPPPTQAQGVVTPAASDAVTSQEQFDALPSGSIYTGADGRKYRKP